MAAISEVRSANAALKNTHDSLTAVFTGATSGIGLATLRAFAKHVSSPTAIIVGRDQSKFAHELDTLKGLNPNGVFTFLEADISLIKNIDTVSSQIRQQLAGRKIDLLTMSQGYISFSGRENNAEGLDNSISLRYYGRVRFAQNLLPSMAPQGRVMSVLAGGLEGKIIEDDLDLERKYGIASSAAQFASFMTLTFDKMAEENRELTFIHVFPGLVSTGLLGRSATGVLGVLFRWLLQPVMKLFVLKPEEVGERMLYYGTGTGKYEKGSWSLDQDGEAKQVDVLREYREKGWKEKVTDHNEKMFERALSQ